MPVILIRDIPPEVLSALERRAARHERSLEDELRYILTGIAQEEKLYPSLPPLDLKVSQASPQTHWSREEIYGDDER
jgi:plasmid stability protein